MEKVVKEAAKAAQGPAEVPLDFQPLMEDFSFPNTSHDQGEEGKFWEGPLVPETEKLIP